jgi:hypothetical protein
LGEQSVALQRDLHDEYLRKELEVIEETEAVDKLLNVRT